MIITQETAKKLIEKGSAGNKQFVWGNGADHEMQEPEYVAIDRYDLQRVDHYPPTDQDLRNWADGKDANGGELD
jgi:hypothetical protein